MAESDGGFSSDWLDLREPYDHAARSKSLLKRLANWSAGRPSLQIVDLGSGRGSTFRAVSPHLRCEQSWRLVDHDMTLLQAMRDEPVELCEADLAKDLEHVATDADLITASALIDLVSKDWLERLVALKKPLYIALTFDGRVEWQPEDPLDGTITGLFCRHQTGDKGFGPALGSDAGKMLATLLGDNLVTETSDWLFDVEDQIIQFELIDGFAGAASELSGTTPVHQWAERRRGLTERREAKLMIGHVDQLWLP